MYSSAVTDNDDRLAGDAQGQFVQQLQIQRRGFADPGHRLQFSEGGRGDPGQGAEAVQQGLGRRFHITTRTTAEQEQLQDFIIRHPGEGRSRGPLTQALPVAGMGGRAGRDRAPKLPLKSQTVVNGAAALHGERMFRKCSSLARGSGAARGGRIDASQGPLPSGGATSFRQMGEPECC